MVEHARHHQTPIEADVPGAKDSGLGVHTENIIDGIDKIEAMAALVESVIVWRAQYIAWNVDIFKAETLLFRLIYKENSQNPQAMDLLARIYFQQGKYEKARSLWDKALELQPGNPVLRRTATEMQRISKSPGSTVARHRISVLLNYLLVLLLICVLALFIELGYKRLLKLAEGPRTTAAQNIESVSSRTITKDTRRNTRMMSVRNSTTSYLSRFRTGTNVRRTWQVRILKSMVRIPPGRFSRKQTTSGIRANSG
ncbi:MAG: tetratricopeptide repeat protein [Synergistaceae bacterium]|nr:tetratricopeptide repeat protein [Synergistaceae bacterium]